MSATNSGFRLRLAAVLILALSAVSVPAAYAFPEPDGWDKVKFGMRETEVKQLYPKMVLLTATPAPDAPKPPFSLNHYQLDNQTVGPLKDCTVGLRFFQLELYEIQFRCPDKEKETKYLTERFGSPTTTSDVSLIWMGTKSSVTHTPAGGVFMFGDAQRTQKLTVTIMAFMGKQQQAPNASNPAPANPPAK